VARSLPVVAPASVVAFAPRDRVRRLVREAFPRRQGRVVVARSVPEFSRLLRAELVDAAVLDAGAGEDVWAAAELARELPSVPFVAVVPSRAADAGLVARAVAADVADVILEGVDETVLAALVEPLRFTSRFRLALREPPPALRLTSPLQLEVWRSLVALAGRPTTTAALAERFGVTREHLSRSFSTGGAPTLKRAIDLVRVCVAAELAKNPGYDVADVARILGFASSSHLATTTQRLVGTRPSSLARLRTVDLLERFAV
jgi:AraC-like DNA-binding protein